MANTVYQMVTDRIIEQINKGVIPWLKPWHLAGTSEEVAINYVSRKPYSTLNQWILMEPGEYLTFTQIKALKGDPKAIVFAASRAEKAARFILGERNVEPANA